MISYNTIPKAIELKPSSGDAHRIEISRQMLRQADPSFTRKHRSIERFLTIQESDIFKRDDYHKPLDDYLNYHTLAVLQKYFGFKGLEGKNILQIAPNFGSYMHFLKKQFNVNAFGVDKNERAMLCSRKLGLNFIVGDASKLAFKDDFFHAVISQYFLDPCYLNDLFSKCWLINANYKVSFPFMDSVISEAHRTLRPSGIFISMDETIPSELQALGKFSTIYNYKNFICPPIRKFSNLFVMQK